MTHVRGQKDLTTNLLPAQQGQHAGGRAAPAAGRAFQAELLSFRDVGASLKDAGVALCCAY